MKRLLQVILIALGGMLNAGNLVAETTCAELKSWTLTSDSPGRGYPLAGPMPLFPIEMGRAGIQGTCTVKIMVGTDGRVAGVTVLHVTIPEFEAPTVTAVKQWRFIEVVNKGRHDKPLGMIFVCTLAYVLSDH